MMKSIRLKMVIMYIILVFIVMIACGTFTIISLRVSETNKYQRYLSDSAEMIKEYVIDAFTEADFPRELMSITRIGTGANQIESNILNASGSLLATNLNENPIVVPAYNSSVIISAMTGESTFASWRKYPNLQGLEKPWMEYARPVIAKSGTTYIIYLRIDATSINDSIVDITGIFALGLLIALALAIVLGIIFADSVNKPIRLLTRKTGEFARGNLDQTIEVYSRDEIGQLSESFSNMAKELSQTLSSIENEKNKVETVLNNVTDGVLAYAADGRLIHANHVCQELLGVSDIADMTLTETMTWLKLPGPAVGPVESMKDAVLNINDRFLNVSLTVYKGGVILLLQDLTKHIMLDNMRKEFVANVSHELRTPLTTIKSYTETLLDELPDTAEAAHNMEFLKTIDGETDRMTILVNDLLELSRLDNKQMEFNFRAISLTDLLAKNIAIHRHALRKKNSGKTILYEPTGGVMTIDADVERLNQVMNNIITNALRYSGDNAKVEIKAEDTGGYYRVIVRDNGMGIPAGDLERIFERFYRVDKARSRELGGTGLGLSISKEIIEAHGGTLTAHSQLGVGTTMTIDLKKRVGEPGQPEVPASVEF